MVKPSEVSRVLAQAARVIEDPGGNALLSAGFTFGDTMNAEISRKRANKWKGRAGSSFTWSYRVKKRGDEMIYIYPTSAGPAVARNEGTKAHRITPRRGRGKYANRHKALGINGVARASANHPGSKGTGFAKSGSEKGNKNAAQRYQQEMVNQLGRVFTGR